MQATRRGATLGMRKQRCAHWQAAPPNRPCEPTRRPSPRRPNHHPFLRPTCPAARPTDPTRPSLPPPVPRSDPTSRATFRPTRHLTRPARSTARMRCTRRRSPGRLAECAARPPMIDSPSRRMLDGLAFPPQKIPHATCVCASWKGLRFNCGSPSWLSPHKTPHRNYVSAGRLLLQLSGSPPGFSLTDHPIKACTCASRKARPPAPHLRTTQGLPRCALGIRGV